MQVAGRTMTNGLGPARNFWFVLRWIIVLALFVLGILPSLIVLKADLEGPSSLRDLLLDRSKLPIRNTNNARTINRNTNTKVTSRPQSLCHNMCLTIQGSRLIVQEVNKFWLQGWGFKFRVWAILPPSILPRSLASACREIWGERFGSQGFNRIELSGGLGWRLGGKSEGSGVIGVRG